MNLKEELGVQSYSLRSLKDNATVAACVKDLGMSAVELCRTHADFSKRDVFDGVIRTYADAGVRIVSTGVNLITGDEKQDRSVFDFAKAAGIRHMSIAFTIESMPECLRAADLLADEYDLRLGIHNHGGRHWLGNAETLSWIFSQSSERIGLCLDTGWAIDAGEEPVKLIEQFPGRIHGVHFKDFSFGPSRKPTPVTAGEGLLDLTGVIGALTAAGFEGYAVIEHESREGDPVSQIRACAAAIKSAC